MFEEKGSSDSDNVSGGGSSEEDFKALQKFKTERRGTFVGTPKYTSPEML